MIRFLLFMVGASAFIAGMYLTCANFSGLIIAFLGLCICELIFANRRLTSHLSTFCENVYCFISHYYNRFGYIIKILHNLIKEQWNKRNYHCFLLVSRKK